VVVQAKFREIAKTITTPRFLVFLAISRTPKKMSEPGAVSGVFDWADLVEFHVWGFLIH
jgi:hypothetical protein